MTVAPPLILHPLVPWLDSDSWVMPAGSAWRMVPSTSTQSVSPDPQAVAVKLLQALLVAVSPENVLMLLFAVAVAA